jgi:hypothetical protein
LNPIESLRSSFRLSPKKSDKKDDGEDSFSHMADKKGKPAEECYLTFKDFEEIDQTGDRPEIMIHVIKTLTGINVASQPDTIKEEP